MEPSVRCTIVVKNHSFNSLCPMQFILLASVTLLTTGSHTRLQLTSFAWIPRGDCFIFLDLRLFVSDS